MSGKCKQRVVVEVSFKRPNTEKDAKWFMDNLLEHALSFYKTGLFMPSCPRGGRPVGFKTGQFSKVHVAENLKARKCRLQLTDVDSRVTCTNSEKKSSRS